MTFVDWFAGVGGFRLGLERSGHRAVWACELDPAARRVYGRRFGHEPEVADITAVSPENIPDADLWCGGFPCQDLSVAGRRAGIREGTRSGLWWAWHRLIAARRPEWLLVENVPGLFSSDRGRDFLALLDSLDELGYGLAWAVLDAQHFGVPQRRRRVFVVGHRGDWRGPAEVLSLRKGGGGHPAAGGGAGQVSPALPASGAGTGRTGNARTEAEFLVMPETAYALRANPSHSGDKGDGGVNTTLISGTLQSGGGGPDDNDAQANHLVVAPALMARSMKAGDPLAGNTPMVASEQGRGVRRLMPVECERLMGFPDGWTEGESDSVRYRLLGNSVAVPVVRWIGERMKEMTR